MGQNEKHTFCGTLKQRCDTQKKHWVMECMLQGCLFQKILFLLERMTDKLVIHNYLIFVFLKNSKLITNGKIFAFEEKWKIFDLPVMCTILEFQQLVLIGMGISDTFLTMDCELMKLCAGHVTD